MSKTPLDFHKMIHDLKNADPLHHADALDIISSARTFIEGCAQLLTDIDELDNGYGPLSVLREKWEVIL